VQFSDSPEQQEKDVRALRACKIRSLQIESTSRCNLRCFMCDRVGPGKDMEVELCRLLVGRFPAVSEIVPSGLGEPLSARRPWRWRTDGQEAPIF